MKIIITSFALLFIPILKAISYFLKILMMVYGQMSGNNEVYTDPTSGDTILATNETNWRIGTNFQDIEGIYSASRPIFLDA